MATIDSLRTLVIEQLRDIYDAEHRLTKAIPKLRRKAENEELREALDTHLSETEEHIARLDQVFAAMDEKAKGKPCAGIKGIIDEGKEHVGEDYDEDDLRDAVIIGAAQRAEHYEIAAYGTVIAHMRLLGEDEAIAVLEETLEEEKACDRTLTDIAERVVNVEAAEDESDEAEKAPRRASGRRQKSAGVSRLSTAADARTQARARRR